MPEQYRHRILQHVTHKAYQPRGLDALAAELNVDLADRPAFEETLNQLIDEGQVVLGAAQTIALPPPGPEMVGTFRRHERGFGFIIPQTPNAHGDLFVPAHETANALTGDTVRAKVIYDRRRASGTTGHSPYTGRIIEIIQRAANKYTGTLEKRGSTYLVIPDGRAMNDPIIIRDPHAKHANPGDKIVVEITRFAQGNMLAEGVITEVLGEPGEPEVETLAVCRVYGLAESFPEPVLQQARDIVKQYESDLPRYMEARIDLSNDYIITIDPPTAQDFDDAISVRRHGAGYELGVHIADVAAFVTAGSPLDEEAERRGNSAYLPRRVVPMLPEVLSNGICSLQADVPRLTRTIWITYDSAGKPTGSRFARTLIRSAHRLTYIEAQHLIDGRPDLARPHARYDGPYTDQLIDTLKLMDELAKTIRNRRLHDGMIVLDLPEVELIYDDKGRVVDAQPEDDSFTHKLIEAFMVEANEAIARVFADLVVPLIRRTHPEPSSHDTTELRAFARVAGFTIPQNPTRKDLQRLLDAVRGTPASKAVHFAVLRTLTRAEYSPNIIGHFALASEHYTHFTSPIRRYPDLLVHRAMDALLATLGEHGRLPRSPVARKRIANDLRSDPRVLDETALLNVGRHCSLTERNAEAAERELRNLLVMQLLEREHIGDIFDGTVTGVAGFGVFIQIDKYLVDGMIRLTDLPGAPADTWKHNPHTGSLTAQRSGKTLAIGDRLKVQINGVDLARRELTLLIVDPKFLGSKKAAKPEGPRPTQAVEKARRGRKGKFKEKQQSARPPQHAAHPKPAKKHRRRRG